jgi:glycerol kinase
VVAVSLDDELCNLFDVPMQALPEVRESFAEFSATSSIAELPRSLPICGVMGDSQASLFAQRCYQSGTAKATFGTGTSVLVNIGQEPRVSKLGAVSALAWVLNGRPTYAMEGLINYSSATVSWLKDQLGLIDSAAQTESLARSVSDNGGVYLVPAFAGLSAPYWSPEARAAIVGMTSFTRKEHIVRAALESIAYQIRDVLEMISADTGAAPKIVHADGGPTRNEFLMQLVADITRLELVVADVTESSALGAAMAGMLGSRLVSSLDELASMARETRCYRPQMDAEQADRLYAGWKAAVKRVL